MNISKNTWHYRVFNFWFKQVHEQSVEEYAAWDKEATFNLCPYVRIVLLWAPLRFVFSRPRIWWTLSVLAVAGLGILYKYCGVHGLIALAASLVYVALILSFIVGVIWAVEKTKEKVRRHPIQAITRFTEVLSERAKAAHDGICPIIHFVDDGKK